MHAFKAKIEIIGVNPFVFVPPDILETIFIEAEKDRGPVPVHGLINGKPFTQTLMRFAGEWRLYINMKMLKDSPRRIGEIVEIEVDFDKRSRSLPMHPSIYDALQNDPTAKKAFESLSPSRQHEINRYISHIKSEEKVRENVQRAMDYLNGKGSFAGRSKL